MDNSGNNNGRRPEGNRPFGNRPANNQRPGQGRPVQRTADGRPVQKRPVDGQGRPVQRTADGRPVQKRPVDGQGRPVQRTADGRPVRRPVDGQGRPVQRTADGRPVQRTADGRTVRRPVDRNGRPLTDEEIRRRKEMQRRKRLAEEKKKKKKRIAGLVGFFISLIFLVGLAFGLTYFFSVRNTIKIEIGSDPIEASEFDLLPFAHCEAVEGFDDVDYNSIGEYPVVVKAIGFTHNVKVVIQDTKKPVVETQSVEAAINTEVDPDRFIATVTDATSTKVAYDKKPDFSKDGVQKVSLIIKDEAGNESKAQAQLTLYSDKEAPSLEGIKELQAYIGDAISYKAGLIATDNMDPDPKIEVDNSQVDLEHEGTYPITFIVRDAAGNESRYETNITLSVKPDGYVEPEVVLELANQVLDEILKPDMDESQKLYAIWTWVHTKIGYVQSDYKESWTGGAYIGLTKRSGDCYIFFSTAKALLTAAGFENIDVIKKDISHSRHYWNLVNSEQGWYHFDTTNFASGAKFFMYTDAALDKYSAAHKQSHNRDMSLYPATPTVEYKRTK